MSFEAPPNYDAYLQEQLARWAVEDVNESETPEEEIARREKRARITQAAVNRYLLNFAEYGTCGDPLRSESGKLDIALAYAEEAEADDLAVAEPLKNLHWILKNGTHEECAQAVGNAWRAQHPFRPTRAGDPYEMLAPQNDRVRAMIALDQAATLPTLPSMKLHYIAGTVDKILNIYPNSVYDDYCERHACTRAEAEAIAQQAQQAWERIRDRHRELSVPMQLHAEFVKYHDHLRDASADVRVWAQGTLRKYGANDAAVIQALLGALNAAKVADSYVKTAKIDLPQAEAMLQYMRDRTMLQHMRERSEENSPVYEQTKVDRYRVYVTDADDVRKVVNALGYLVAYETSRIAK